MTSFLVESSELLECEALVIGSGAGGSSVALTLANAGLDVLIVEEGPYVPAADAPPGLAQSMLRMWRGGGLLTTLGGAQIAMAEGRCVGGGTEINSAIFQRAANEVISEWAITNRLRDFTPDLLAPYYEQAAAEVSASRTLDVAGPPTDILVSAGNAMNWKVTSLERGQRSCVGTNLCSAGCPTGAKQSMSSTLIPRALERRARLIAQCRVTRILFEGKRATGALAEATGVEGRRHGLKIRAESVFVCAGTTQTPLLLKRSALNKDAGRTFQLHPTVRVVAKFPWVVNAHRYRLPLAAITEFSPKLRIGGSINSVSTYAMAMAEDWTTRSKRLADYASSGIYYAMLRPDGVGRLRNVPRAESSLATYSLTERDWRFLADGLCKLAQALFAAGATHVFPSIRNHPGWSSPRELDRTHIADTLRRRASLMSIHLFSSCPMGEGAGHLVNSYGALIGFENVMIADGSVLPNAPGVNPQATIMALAFRTAEAFLTRQSAH